MLLQHIFSTVFVASSYQKNYVFDANDNLCGCPCKCGLPLAFCLEVAAFICLL